MHIVPQFWFPNTWSWPLEKPTMPKMSASVVNEMKVITADHPEMKTHLYCLPSPPPVGPNDSSIVDDDVAAVETVETVELRPGRRQP